MTTTIVNINIDDMDTQFVEDLKRDFAHSTVEIRVQNQQEGGVVFSDADFWNAIGLLDWSKSEDDDEVVAPLIAFLIEQPLANIYRFFDLLSGKLWNLDTYAHAKVFLDDPEEEGILSVDDFLYTRCAVVANGPEYYEKVLNAPHLMPQDLTFEPLLYVAMKAYKQKTGKTFSPVAAFNYETYSNKKGWERKK